MKWKELGYDECYWEFESDISAFQPEIERFNKIQSRRSKKTFNKNKTSTKDAVELTKKQKEFQQYEQSPAFLSGGTLLSATRAFFYIPIWYIWFQLFCYLLSIMLSGHLANF